jgi:enamine deaminase RidA (YjgF/YER057c/UK114 family)
MSSGLSSALLADLQVRRLARQGMEEMFLTSPGAAVADLPLLAKHLSNGSSAAPVASEYFGPSAPDELAELPLTWVLALTASEALRGLHLHAVAEAEVKPLLLDGQIVGTAIEGPYATEVRLAGLHSGAVNEPRPVQARLTFERMEEALALAGMDFSHVARTWLFLDDILDWYDDFNPVRTEFFTERGVFDRMVPASTGIGGSNPAGAAMVAGVYAVKANAPGVSMQAVPSPLQCPALDYGSSFSRAVEVTMPDLRRLMISGTASIEPGGETVHVDDVVGQTALTCDVVEAILKSRGMGWEDVTRATAYVRHAKDAGVFETHRKATGMPPLPVVVAHNTICRGNLLFELEVDATQAV